MTDQFQPPSHFQNPRDSIPILEASVSAVQQILEQLRTELVDKAYELELQRRIDAADIAVTFAARVEELSRVVGESLGNEEPALQIGEGFGEASDRKHQGTPQGLS